MLKALLKISFFSIILAAIIAFLAYSHNAPATNPTASAPELSVADQQKAAAERKRQQKECDKFIKEGIRLGVIHSYRGPLITVGPQWYGLSYDGKNSVAGTLGKCLYLGQDASTQRLVGFYDYYTGKRLGFLGIDGQLSSD